MVVEHVLVENTFGVSPAPHDDVVETVPTQGSDDALAECVRLGRSRWSGEQARAEPADTLLEIGAVDRIAVMNEKGGACPASAVASTSPWPAQAAVGCSVTPTWTRRRR